MSDSNSVLGKRNAMEDTRASFRNSLFSQLSLVQTPVDFETGLYLIDPRLRQLNELQVDQKYLIKNIVSSLREFRKRNLSVSPSFLDLCKKIADFLSSKQSSPHHWKYFLLLLIDEARKESCLYELFPPDQFEELHAYVIQLRRPRYYEIGRFYQREIVPLGRETASEHELECLTAKQMFESSTYVQRTQYLFHLLMTYPKDFLRLIKSPLLVDSLEQIVQSGEMTGSERQSSPEHQLAISLLNDQLDRIPRPGRLSKVKKKIIRLLKHLLLIFFVSCLCLVTFYSLTGLFRNSGKGQVLLIPDEQYMISEESLASQDVGFLKPVVNSIQEDEKDKDFSFEANVLGTNFSSFQEFQATERVNKVMQNQTNIFRFAWKHLHQLRVLLPLSIAVCALYWYISRAVERRKECEHHTEVGRHRWFLRSSCPYCRSQRAATGRSR
jgi:hypothetical protein